MKRTKQKGPQRDAYNSSKYEKKHNKSQTDIHVDKNHPFAQMEKEEKETP